MKRILFVFLLICAAVAHDSCLVDNTAGPETEGFGVSVFTNVRDAIENCKEKIIGMRVSDNELYFGESDMLHASWSDYLVDRVKKLEKRIFEFDMRFYEIGALNSELLSRLEARIAALEFLVGEGIYDIKGEPIG
jgi:hypothetical protein